MTDINSKIADLLEDQTYEERMQMSRWFADILRDALAEDSEAIDADFIASTLSLWVQTEFEDATEPDRAAAAPVN